jgi:hypothetical protein
MLTVPEKTWDARKSMILELEGALSSLSVFFVCMVWIPSVVMAVLLLVGVQSVWLPAATISALLLVVLWHFLFGTHLRQGKTILLVAIMLSLVLVAAGFSILLYVPRLRTSPSGSAMATAIVSAWTSKPKNRTLFFMTGSSPLVALNCASVLNHSLTHD